ncbi:hypothetical protein [Lacinutrix sp. Bg11-31]|uniref:hypothetical protein n=1 Tax=Lacinutrix sp. Bg11-31 TaxID=2057808 RepID=UPI000C30A1D6|nr:hypothetical protein [Lacinutrix sp. Bg11-31]AUC82814.1 hypothetical protein CW733_12050 [Lacinutrix sp. Bg11-31]
MRFLLITVILSFTFSGAIAQNGDLPKNPKPGKCYERCFYYDKPIEWEEVDCNNIRQVRTNRVTHFTLKNIDEQKARFIAYQQQLIDLGYKLEANGFLDKKTANAHYKYLNFKKKQVRKAKRRNRK